MKNVDSMLARGNRVFLVLEWPSEFPHPPGKFPSPRVKNQTVQRDRLMSHVHEQQYKLLDHRFTPESCGYEEVSLLEIIRLRPATQRP
jgi:hypothetical protein